MFYWVCKYILIGPLLRLLFRPQVVGLEHLPEDGAAILAGNHLSFSDSIFLPMVCKRKITFLAKSDYFHTPGFKGWLTKLFMSAVGQVPVDRSGGKASEAALNTGLARLREGGLFGIYPEGTRSPDGRLYRGKTGVARLALESGCPVVPVAMIATEEAQPLGKVMPRPVRVGVVVGEPLDFSRYHGMQDDRFILRSVTDEIMYALMSLSGQEYVDIYAATAKARIAAGQKSGADAAPSGKAPGGRTAPDVHVPVPPEEGAAPSVD